jgi:hypothetical protein
MIQQNIRTALKAGLDQVLSRPNSATGQDGRCWAKDAVVPSRRLARKFIFIYPLSVKQMRMELEVRITLL